MLNIGIIGGNKWFEKSLCPVNFISGNEISYFFHPSFEINPSVPEPNHLKNLIKQCHALIIVENNPQPYEISKMILKLGKHLFLLNPFSLTLDESKHLVKLCDEAGVIFQSYHPLRSRMQYLLQKNNISNPPTLLQLNKIINPEFTNVQNSSIKNLWIDEVDTALFLMKNWLRKFYIFGIKSSKYQIQTIQIRLEFSNHSLANLLFTIHNPFIKQGIDLYYKERISRIIFDTSCYEEFNFQHNQTIKQPSILFSDIGENLLKNIPEDSIDDTKEKIYINYSYFDFIQSITKEKLSYCTIKETYSAIKLASQIEEKFKKLI